MESGISVPVIFYLACKLHSVRYIQEVTYRLSWYGIYSRQILSAPKKIGAWHFAVKSNEQAADQVHLLFVAVTPLSSPHTMNVVQSRSAIQRSTLIKAEEDAHASSDVNFYNEVPDYELSLDEFEEFALKRLKVN